MVSGAFPQLPELKVLHVDEAGGFTELPVGVVGNPSLSLVGIDHFPRTQETGYQDTLLNTIRCHDIPKGPPKKPSVVERDMVNSAWPAGLGAALT